MGQRLGGGIQKVEEARLLTKYKGLVFNDPDSGSTFSVWDPNMEFRRGRGNGWFVVGVSADKPDNESCNEPFSLEMACELIGATKQKAEGGGSEGSMRRNGVGMGRGSGFPGCITLFPNILKLVKLFSNTHI